MKRSVLAVSAACILAAGQALAGFPHGLLPPYINGDGLTDGSRLTNGYGSLQDANLFSVGPQSGQSYGGIRPAWKVAGVDYPVGYDTTLTLKDPAIQANLPTACTYYQHGRSPSAFGGAPVIDCDGGQSFTLNGFDFSGALSSATVPTTGTCAGTPVPACMAPSGGIDIFIEASTNKGVTCTFTNNRFKFGPNNHQATLNVNSGAGNPPIYATSSSTGGCNGVFQHNDMSGGWPTYTDDYSFVTWVSSGDLDFEFNAMHDMSTRPETNSGGGCPSVVWRYNYMKNVTMIPWADGHGEEFATFIGGCAINHVNADFNTLYIPTTMSNLVSFLGETLAAPTVTSSANIATLTYSKTTNVDVYNTIFVSGILPTTFDGYFTVISKTNGVVTYDCGTACGAYVSGTPVVKDGAQWTAPFYFTGTANSGMTITTATMNNNVLLNNTFNGTVGHGTVAVGTTANGYSYYNSFHMNDNYSDCTGSYYAYIQGASTVTASVDGTTGIITVTSAPIDSGSVQNTTASPIVQTGAIIWSPPAGAIGTTGFAVGSQISSSETLSALNGKGTYNSAYRGANITSAVYNLTPAFGTRTFTNNKNLVGGTLMTIASYANGAGGVSNNVCN